VTDLASQLPESEETSALGVSSRLLQLDYAWRLGMERERVDALAAEAREIATRTGDLRSLTLLRLLEGARPGLDHHTDEWTQSTDDAISLADESGDDALRMAIRTAGSFAYLCAGDYDHTERLLDEALEIAGDDHALGGGIVIGCPYAWAVMAKGLIRRDRGELDDGEELFETALRIAAEQGDTETEGWTRGNLAVLLAYRGDVDRGLGLAQRNYELTERLGDVFSRQWALLYLATLRLEHGDAEGALDAAQRADRLYREAMDRGGEAEPWRCAALAEALLALGRARDALEPAERGAKAARERGLGFSLARALRALGSARVAAGEPGAIEAFDEAERVAAANGQRVELERIEQARDSAQATQA
jgi:tetratricopeptide (TPR) repeat protein